MADRDGNPGARLVRRHAALSAWRATPDDGHLLRLEPELPHHVPFAPFRRRNHQSSVSAAGSIDLITQRDLGLAEKLRIVPVLQIPRLENAGQRRGKVALIRKMHGLHAHFLEPRVQAGDIGLRRAVLSRKAAQQRPHHLAGSRQTTSPGRLRDERDGRPRQSACRNPRCGSSQCDSPPGPMMTCRLRSSWWLSACSSLSRLVSMPPALRGSS